MRKWLVPWLVVWACATVALFTAFTYAVDDDAPKKVFIEDSRKTELIPPGEWERTTTSTTSTTSTTVAVVPASLGTCDSPSRYYPEGWYTEPVLQETQEDLMPDPQLCEEEYLAWLRRQAPDNVAVAHCIPATDGMFQWAWGDPEYQRYQERGTDHQWACVGMTPEEYMSMWGDPFAT